MQQRHLRTAIGAALMAITVVSACSGGGTTSSAPGAPAATGTASASGGGGAATEVDRAFIDMMVPHHESAVEMATVATSRAQREELREMAQDIIAAQGPEIEQLRQWRQAWFGSSATPSMDEMPLMPGMEMPGMEGHGMGGTMDMTEDIEALRTADPFDSAFIEAMVEHHRSAIAAAEIIKGSTQRQELRTTADQIIATQQAEIDQLEAWRAEWYPG